MSVIERPSKSKQKSGKKELPYTVIDKWLGFKAPPREVAKVSATAAEFNHRFGGRRNEHRVLGSERELREGQGNSEIMATDSEDDAESRNDVMQVFICV